MKYIIQLSVLLLYQKSAQCLKCTDDGTIKADLALTPFADKIKSANDAINKAKL